MSTTDQLENRLGELAMQYRSLGSSDKSTDATIAEYAAVYRSLINDHGWNGFPDADAELPREDMPEEFRQLIASCLTPQTHPHSDVMDDNV